MRSRLGGLRDHTRNYFVFSWAFHSAKVNNRKGIEKVLQLLHNVCLLMPNLLIQL